MPGILNALKLGVVSLRQGHLTGSVVDAKATSNLKGEVRVVGELGLIYMIAGPGNNHNSMQPAECDRGLYEAVEQALCCRQVGCGHVCNVAG